MVEKSAMVPASEVRSFRDLRAWQEALELSIDVHRAAAELPAEHRFELGRELRRSAISVPSNVAEGFSRHSRKVYRSQVAIALGSNAELATQLEILKRLNLLDGNRTTDLIARSDDLARLLQGLWRSLRTRASTIERKTHAD